MKFKNLVLLSLIFIFILLSSFSLLNYFYLQKVYIFINGNELEEIKTAVSIKKLLTSYLYFNFFIFCFCVFIIFTINLLLLNYIIKNLKKFTFSIKKMTEGNLETHIDIKSKK